MPEPVEDLVIALYRLGRVQRAIARDALAELGGQGFAALAVVHREGPVRVSAVAGYVEREPDPDDRRATRIHLTEAGTRVLRDSHRRMVSTAETALDAWSAEDVTSLAAQLERLREDFAVVASLPIQKDAA